MSCITRLSGCLARFRHLWAITLALLCFSCLAHAQAGQIDSQNHASSDSGPLTLDQCIAIALQRNSSLLISRGQVDQFEAASLSSWSNMMPQISATLFNSQRNVQGDRLFTTTVQQTQPDGSVALVKADVVSPGQSINSFFSGVSVNQPIYDGGASWNRIRQARQNTRTAMLNEDATERQVALTVKQQYYNLLKSMRLYEVQEERVKLSAEQLRQSEAMYNLGTVAKVDVLRARADLGSSRIAQTAQAALIRQTKAALNTAMGRPMGAPLNIIDTMDTEHVEFPVSVGVDEAIAAAMQDNPDIRSMSAQVQSARMGKKIATGGLLPTVSGFFNYNRNTSQFNRLFENLNQNWSMSFGITLRLNFLNGAQTYGNISRASADYYVAEESLERQKRQTILAIEQAAADLEATRAVIELSRESIDAAEESLRLEQSRYRVGTGRQLDVIDAQLRFIQAKFSLVSALYDYKIAEAALDNAMGRQ